MFRSDKNTIANEKIIYQTRPNMILGSKKAIGGVIVLIILYLISNPIKLFIANIQTYTISFIKIGLTGYVMLAIVVLILIDLIYIIWQLLSWYSTLYTITNERLIIKKGVLYSKKTYMPFRSIQDIDISQSIIGKICNIGTITAYSAYDNNSMVFSKVSNPQEIEEIIFDKLNQYTFQEYPQRQREIPRKRKPYNPKPTYFEEDYIQYEESYSREIPYYDDKPMRSKRSYNKYEYEEFPKVEKQTNYDYERYDDNLEDNLSYAISDMDKKYNLNEYDDLEPFYNDYDYDSMEDFYNNNIDEIEPYSEEIETKEVETTENIIQRHFDKFNR